MKWRKNILQWNWLEIGFFIFYFFILQLVTDKQYAHNEGGSYSFWDSFIDRAVALILMFPAYGFYYKVITRFLFEKRYVVFAVSLVIFLFLLDWYLRCADWVTYHLTFLNAQERIWAQNSFHSSWFNFFSRQTLQLTFMNLFSLTALGYYLKSLDDEKRMHLLKEQRLQMELENLKAQINPHFFFNTLNNIYSLAQQQSQLTTEMVSRLSDLMRYVLYETGQDCVPLEKELDFIKNYIQLEKIRHDENVTVNFEWQGDATGKYIAPLILIPFIENAFKHGLQQETQQGFAEIVMVLEGNELTTEIKNSKPCGKETNKAGIGLANARKRLELLYPSRYMLVIDDTEHYFDVSLSLHLA